MGRLSCTSHFLFLKTKTYAGGQHIYRHGQKTSNRNEPQNNYHPGTMVLIKVAVNLVCVFRDSLSICRCNFPCGFEGVMWYLIVFIPDHCLSIYSTGSNPLFWCLAK